MLDVAQIDRGTVIVGVKDSQPGFGNLEPDGTFVDAWSDFGRPSGIYINRATDTLYVTDSTSNASTNPGVQRGIYVGSARTGELDYFIPDPDLERADQTRISGASGITSSHDDSVVYAADVAPWQLRQYVRR